MTGEEMERAIEFLLQSQANYESRLADISARQDRTDEQIAETGRQLATYAQTQSQFIEIVTQAMTNLADAQAATERAVRETNARLGDTNDRLNKLIGLFEQHIVAAH
jgi:flagellar biosynthesis chaperone FliJ